MPARLIVGEYNVLWEALKHYEQHLLRAAANATDEDAQLDADDRLLKLDSIRIVMQVAAKEDWDLDLR